MRDERTLDLAPDPDGARTAAESARGMLAGVDPESAFACELSVAEACANVVEHAASGRLRVVIRRSPQRFSAAVCDEGEPFQPDAAPGFPPPAADRGRGVALMAACMDRIRVVRTGSENRLLMTRRIGPEEAGTTTGAGAGAGDRLVVLEGRLDMRAAGEVRERVGAAIDAAGGSLVLDLAAVEFIDSSGLAALAALHRASDRLGGRLAIVPPAGPAGRIFALTRTEGFFLLVPDRGAGRAALAG